MVFLIASTANFRPTNRRYLMSGTSGSTLF
jgi:hypothetical protein